MVRRMSMSIIDRALESPTLKRFAVVVSLLAGIFKLAGGAFPDQIQDIAIGLFAVAVGYLVLSTLRTASLYLESGKKWRTEIEQRLETRIPDDEGVFGQTAKRYGMGYESMDIECEVRDDGVKLHRLLRIRAYSVLRQIDNTLYLRQDAGSSNQLVPPTIKSMDNSRTLSIEHAVEVPNTVVVSISPPLRETETAEFVLTEEIRGAFYKTTISRAELQRRNRENDQDFFAWRIDRPTRKLSLKVTFPSNAKPTEYSYNVFFAPITQGLPTREQHEELKRLNGPLLRTSHRGQPQLVLDVDYPAVGLLYAIYWNPSLETD
jgi:hypothetical protein